MQVGISEVQQVCRIKELSVVRIRLCGDGSIVQLHLKMHCANMQEVQVNICVPKESVTA